jgi:tetratricopeptide (TPR) repeat protein
MTGRLGAALGAALLLAVGLTGAAAPGAAQQTDPVVRVRAGVHPDRNRLVFEWPGSVDYTVAQQGDTIQITFSRPGKADFAAVQRAKLRNVPTVGQTVVDGRLVVQFTIPPGSGINHFRPGSGGVAIDIVDPPRNAAPAPAAVAPAPAAVQAPAQTAVAPAAATQQPKQPAQPKPAAAAKPEAAAKPQAARKQLTPPPAMTSTLAPAPNPTIPAPPPPSASPLTPVAAQPLAAPPSGMRRGGITVEAQEPAAAAVYTRAGFLYVVFGRPLELDGRIKVDALVPGLGGAETVPLRGATAFRMALPDGVEPIVTRDGNTWRIGLGPRASAPPEGLPVDAQRDFPLGARLVVGVPDARQVIQIKDPVVGDQLILVPLPNPGQAVGEPHGFSQLRLLPAAQGIVVQPLEDTVAVRPIRDGVEITSAGGLRLSPPADLAGVSPTRLSGRGREAAPASGLFDLAKWRGGPTSDFNKLRQKTQQTVVNTPEAERDRARLDLAHFYFAHGLAAESLGLLGIVAGNQPDLETRPEFQALRGAARVLYGDPQSASDDLANPALDRQDEAVLWRAAAEAKRGDWPAAARDFERSRGTLDGYPDPFYTKLAALAVEARIRTGDRTGATRQLDALTKRTGGEFEKKPIGQFLRGQLRVLAGNKEEAAASFRAAAVSNDRLYRTRAELALVELEMEKGTLTPTDAVARLERLRFAWRGDDLELDILQRLGDAYMKAHNYAEGFTTIRQAAELFPDNQRAARMTAGLSQTFADLYAKDGAADLSPVEALGLYDQFKDLAPAGPQGNEVIRQLAERMIEIDLLGRAGDLLQGLVTGKLQGLDKGKVGTRLATIRLQDSKPDQAIMALDQSVVPELTPPMVAERRILRARALADLKRYGEAVALLKEDTSQPAELLRVDIAWRGAQWPEAASGLAKVIGPPPPDGTPLSKDKADLVLNQAVALSLAGDNTGLDRLRSQFGNAMAAGPHADTFRVLARPGQSGGLIDLASIQSRVKEVGTFQKFLAGQRGGGSAPMVN